MLSQFIAFALALWGWTAPIHIDTADSTGNPAYERVTAYAWAAEWPDGSCTITITPEWKAMDVHMQQNVIIHEVGHCLRLEHLPQNVDAIMNPDPAHHEFSVWDRIEFWRVHPAPYRTFLPMVSH